MKDLIVELSQLSLDEDGRVVLSDDVLEELEKFAQICIAGGSNGTCGGSTNSTCSNTFCSGSTNSTCSNISCGRARNQSRCGAVPS